VYGDFVAKALPRRRAWYYGVSQLLGGLLGFGAALVGQQLLRDFAFPLGNQLCFWLCFGLSFLSIVFISNLKDEDETEVPPRTPLRATLAEIPRIIATDRPYARFLLARVFLASSTLGVGFVVVWGLHRGLHPADAAVLAAVYILSQAGCGFGLSMLGNVAGWKVVVVCGGGLLVAGMGGALLAGSIWAFALVYAALGAANAVTIIGDPNMSIEFAPSRQTSLYLGTTSTLLAPFFVLGPLIGGWLASVLGYPSVFVLALALAVVGFVLSLLVREPRRIVRADAVGQPGAVP
jgi:MFS family permease